MNRSAGVLPLASILFVLASAASAQLSNDQAEERVLGEALAPVMTVIEGVAGVEEIQVEIRGLTTGSQNLGRGVLDFLEARGFAAELRRGQAATPEGTLALELNVLDALFSQAETRRHFLGLAPVKVLRRLDLVMEATLSDAVGGSTLFHGIVEAHAAEWLAMEHMEERASTALLPSRSPADKARGPEAAARTGWTERGIALGLLSGVIILFYSGIS